MKISNVIHQFGWCIPMINLSFLGTGSAFNLDLDNTSAYFCIGHHFYFIDMGERIARKIITHIAIPEDARITIFITHFHADHIASLEPFLVYLTCIKKVKSVQVITPNSKKLKRYLSLTTFDEQKITFNDEKTYTDENVRVVSILAKHIKDSRSYFFYTIEGNFFYSGDTSVISKTAIEQLKNQQIDRIYHEVAVSKSKFHVGIDKLCEKIPLNLRNKVVLMHFENNEIIKKCEKEGFLIAVSSF